MTFNVLCTIWLGFRQIFWSVTVIVPGSWNPAVYYVLYWLPHPIQFGSFLLLPLFYMQVLSKLPSWQCVGLSVWTNRWQCIRNFYILGMASFLGFIVSGGFVVAIQNQKGMDCIYRDMNDDDFPVTDGESCFKNEVTSRPVRIVTAGCFFLLSFVLAVFGVQVAQLDSNQMKRFLIDNPRTLASLNLVLFVAFFSKGIYEVVVINGGKVLPPLSLSSGYDIDSRSFACFLLWDYLPVTLIIATASQTSGRFAARQRSQSWTSAVTSSSGLADYGVFRYIKQQGELRSNGMRSPLPTQNQSESQGLYFQPMQPFCVNRGINGDDSVSLMNQHEQTILHEQSILHHEQSMLSRDTVLRYDDM